MALIKCPDCGRPVSDLAPACLGCGRPIAGAPGQPATPTQASPAAPAQAPTQVRPAALGPGMGGVLRSNLGAVDTIVAPRERKPFPVAIVLVAFLLLIIGAATVLIFTAGRPGSPPPPAASSAAPTSASAPAATPLPVVGANPRSRTAGTGPLSDVNGISCDALESTIFHIHVHLAIFVDGQELQIPLGVGIGQPWQVEGSSEGPFVTDGSCFYWIHTHTEDGVVHIESPIRRRFTLGDFFAIWQVPLSATQVGPAQGPVIAYVNGSRDDTNPADIPLLSHERIQLDIGSDVPPYLFDFPPGD